MYVEAKGDAGHSGEARIGWVTFSKTGRSVYYDGRRFQRLKGGGAQGNYFEVDTGQEYWISGVKSNGEDRHWSGSGPVHVDEDARKEYEKVVAG